MSKIIQIYFIPASVFLSVMIGGGYGTGREVVEFFTQYGLLGGLLAILVSAIIFALVLGLTFDFARVFQVYDYRSFFKQLIGPYWVLFEVLYLLLFLLILGVVSAAAGDILEQRFQIPPLIGLVAMPLLVAVFVLFGRLVVERALALWSILMYAVFICYFVIIIQQADAISLIQQNSQQINSGWLLSGALYALYNLAIAPGLLFTTRHIKTRAQAFSVAAITAIAILIPALLFHLSYTIGSAQVLGEPLPNYWMIKNYGPDWLLLLFIMALLGTLIETGVGLVQSVIERLSSGPSTGKQLGKTVRAAIALISVSLAAMLGSLGIIELISKGYSLMSYGFALVYVLPILSIGVYRLWTHKRQQHPKTQSR